VSAITGVVPIAANRSAAITILIMVRFILLISPFVEWCDGHASHSRQRGYPVSFGCLGKSPPGRVMHRFEGYAQGRLTCL